MKPKASRLKKPTKKVAFVTKIGKGKGSKRISIEDAAQVAKKSKRKSKSELDERVIKTKITSMLEEYTREGRSMEVEEGDDLESHSEDDQNPESLVDIQRPGILKSKDGKEARAEKREKKKKKFDFERNSRTIFVGNLPKSMSQQDIVRLFKSCGAVETARIRNVVPEKEKLAPKVALLADKMHPKVDSFNAYVVFKDIESVKKALDLNGTLVEKHHIRVDRATRPRAKKETLTNRKKSVFVGNLRFDCRDDDLINHFEKVGNVNYVRIVRDRATGLGKGFGFVVFHDRASVKKSLDMNETTFKGRSLRVKKVDKEVKNKK